MLCKLCNGSGVFLLMQSGQPEYWECPCCGGAGVRIQYGPALIGPGARRKQSKS